MIMFYLGLSCMVTGSLGTLGAGAWVWASGRDWALASLISMVGGVDNVDNVDICRVGIEVSQGILHNFES